MSSLSNRPQNKNFGERARIASKKRARINEENYNKKPRRCQQCNEPLPYRSRKQFCNHSCSAIFNNQNRSVSFEQREKTSKSLNKYHLEHGTASSNQYSKKYNGRFCQVQFTECKMCHSSFYVKHHKNIRNQICPECKTADFCKVYTNTCASCGVVFISRAFQKYCYDCADLLTRYRVQASFKFNIYEYQDKFDLSMIDKCGWYSPNGYKRRNKQPNLGGVSRDHMYSVHDGLINGVNPSLLSHPANCQLMLHNGENNKKNSKSSITLEVLQERISLWEKGHL